MKRTLPRILIGLLWLALLGPVTAHALPADPLYFEGPDAWGFDPADVAGRPILADISGAAVWHTAGDSSYAPELVVTSSLVGIVGSEPASPSFADPLLVDVHYSVTNTTGAALESALLVFTRAQVDADSSGGADPFPTIEAAEFGLDANDLLLIEYGPYVFGAIALPDLAAGAGWGFNLTHVIADELGGTLVPAPSMAMLDEYLAPPSVPEPSTSLLLASILTGLALYRRRA